MVIASSPFSGPPSSTAAGMGPDSVNCKNQRQQVMTLGTDEFIRRFLLHVLPKSFHRIRHYGLLAGASRKASLALARKLLAASPPPDDDGPEEPTEIRPPCPCCGGRMIVIEAFARWSQPRAPPHKPNTAGSNGA
jgi:hypothetical protein